jgi:hypothetical protein
MHDAKLLVLTIPIIVNDQFSLVIAILAKIQHSSRALRTNLEISQLLFGQIILIHI